VRNFTRVEVFLEIRLIKFRNPDGYLDEEIPENP